VARVRRQGSSLVGQTATSGSNANLAVPDRSVLENHEPAITQAH
jgi:hypothetical protein